MLVTRVALAIALAMITARPAIAATTSDPVECWIENQTPSVQVGAWDQYVVHMSGGLGTYSVTISYGDGQQDQGTYSSSTAQFSHLFQMTGAFSQSAHVTGAGSQTNCGTSTSVF